MELRPGICYNALVRRQFPSRSGGSAMNFKSILVGAAFAAAAFVVTGEACADEVTLGKTVVSARDVPVRGLSMGQVERRYGAPLDKLPTVGGGAPRQPPINRWRYNGFTVYFERDRVIHSVRDGA